MYKGPDSERFVVCTDGIVLDCRCGESLILIGHEEDWYTEGRTIFECRKCGGGLTLASQTSQSEEAALIGGSEGEDMSVRELIRSLRADQERR
jgi:hypothetical protein